MISYFIVAHCTFLSKLKSQFQVIFVRVSFLWKWVDFRSGQSSFTELYKLSPRSWMVEYLLLPSLFFTRKFPISSRKRSFIEQIVLVVFTDCSFITTKSPIFIFICLQTVAFAYFQYYLIFDISEYVFPASWSR